MGWTRSIIMTAAVIAAGLALQACAIRPSLENRATLPVRAAPAPGQLDVRFLGTSSLAFSDGSHTVLIDGFVTRPGALALAFSRISSDDTLVRRQLAAAGITRVSSVFVAHTHFDHALDAPLIARIFGASLHGTDSLAILARDAGYEPGVTRLESGETVVVGRFRVTPWAMPHSPDDVADGAVRSSFRSPAHALAWREGGNHAFMVQHGDCRMLVVPSAGDPGDIFTDVRTDILFLGIGRLSRQSGGDITRYWERTVGATGARLVIPIHWDDFTRSLDQPLVAMPSVLDHVDLSLDALAEWAPEYVAIRLPLARQSLSWDGLGGRCAEG